MNSDETDETDETDVIDDVEQQQEQQEQQEQEEEETRAAAGAEGSNRDRKPRIRDEAIGTHTIDGSPIADSPDHEWLVDGYNVLHVILLGGEDRRGWWRSENRQRVIERAERLPPERGRVRLVFDGQDASVDPEPDADGLRIVFAASADAWIHQRVRRSLGPRPIVVSSDRQLVRRCRRAGAQIVSPSAFIAACPPDPDDARGPGGSTEPTSAERDDRA